MSTASEVSGKVTRAVPPWTGTSLALPSEVATFSQASLASSGSAKHLLAIAAHDHGLGMREHGSDIKAALAFDIHKE